MPLQDSDIDEVTAGLVESLFCVNDPEYELLHLAVRAQVCIQPD